MALYSELRNSPTVDGGSGVTNHSSHHEPKSIDEMQNVKIVRILELKIFYFIIFNFL